MGTVTQTVCAGCYAPNKINEYGESSPTCRCEHDDVQVEVEVVLSGDAVRECDRARWREWVRMWDDCEKRRSEGPAPYLDPKLNWTRAGRRSRRELRDMFKTTRPMSTALFTKALKDIYTRPTKPGNSFRIPLKSRYDDVSLHADVIETWGASADDFTSIVERNAPIIAKDQDDIDESGLVSW